MSVRLCAIGTRSNAVATDIPGCGQIRLQKQRKTIPPVIVKNELVLPPELEREAFETTALLYPAEIPTLRRALGWIERLLCRVIFLASDDEPRARALLYAMSNKPSSFFRAVRHLGLDLDYDNAPLDIWRPETTYRLLELCTGVVTFYVRPNRTYPTFLPLLAQMHVQRLSADLTTLFGGSGSIDLGHALFRAVTHLNLFEVDLGGLLPDVETHLCVGSPVPRDTALQVLVDCPWLALLLMQWHVSDAEDDAADSRRTRRRGSHACTTDSVLVGLAPDVYYLPANCYPVPSHYSDNTTRKANQPAYLRSLYKPASGPFFSCNSELELADYPILLCPSIRWSSSLDK
ncbi:hypothetical protein C8R47DRAFT_1205609 [Mycena vitilis]|nr:hypothetical protein C8R47DRAFT_1205609 [Mycena vitilis]